MKRLIFIFLLFFSITAFARQVSDIDAVSFVKQNYYPDNSKVNLTIAPVTSILEDHRCLPHDLPDYSWMADGVDKWLVFADEVPNAKWAHPCRYFYIPKTVSDNFELFTYKGAFPPGIDMYSINTARNTPGHIYYDNFPTREYTISEPNVYMDSIAAQKTLVLFIMGGHYKSANNITFFNDCAYMYQVLNQRYKIPKENITVLLGSGGQSGDMINNYTMPMDVDFDGIDDCNGDITRASVTSVLNSYKTRADIKDYELMVFVELHGYDEGEDSEPSVTLKNPRKNTGDDLYASELKYMLDQIPSRAQTVVISACQSGRFPEIMSQPGRVVMASCGADQTTYDDNKYTLFFHKLTNALNERDCHNALDVDTDGNHRISIEEAFEYARGDNYDHYDRDSINTSWIDPIYSIDLEQATYDSNPSFLGNDVSICCWNDTSALYIRDNVLDTGKEYNNTTSIPWYSSDIQIRRQPDYRNETERIMPGDENVYVYVSLKNKGYKDYCGVGKKLRINWTLPALNASYPVWNGETSRLGGIIDDVPLIYDIPDGDSLRFCTPWFLPADLRAYVRSKPYGVDISVLAEIINTPIGSTSVCTNATGTKFNNTGDVLKHNSMALTNAVKTQFSEYIPIGIINDSDSTVNYTLSFETDSALSTNFIIHRMTLQLPVAMYQSWVGNGGRADNVSASASTHSFSVSPGSVIYDIPLAPHQMENLTLRCMHFGANLNAYNELAFDIKLSACDSLVGGIKVRIYDDTRYSVEPLIINIEEQGQQRVLSVVNPEEDESVEWFNPDSEFAIGSGESLVLPASASGDYRAVLTNRNNGQTRSSSVNLIPVPTICNAYPNPVSSVLNVSLSMPAPENTCIVCQPVLSNNVQYIYNIPVNSEEWMIDASSWPAGTYIATLYINGEKTNSIQLLKH